MADTPAAAQRFAAICPHCEKTIMVREAWVGREVQCPHCSKVLRVPPRRPDGRPALAEAAEARQRRGFTFSCGRCGSLLEAHAGLSGQVSTCPTCAARFEIPRTAADGAAVGAARLLDTDTQDPTPMHAYAASGHLAPTLHRRPDGELEIACPRCRARCAVDASLCTACGAPFTIDTAPNISRSRVDGWATSSLVLGVISLFVFILIVPGLLAVLFGLMSVWTGTPSNKALAGIVLGLVSLVAAMALLLM
jgi:DNA-directed RNA polymerase subunit RPC12/RpoP